ncbi:rab11 family-interacting protein 1 isoform X1 [Sinocyclocheilus anshuiensis]|uniref:rab11 family-interacting protein 1 isoform X1 n=1 Tax=Sinocyclocheilus anshuiensis TaxID=1608454 RepID=UPI0007B902A3|nr:PREDICTED: rab11 family-interacting protein 1-like isoform X1 [Sinocyclocheilus anshuiensis]
MPLISLDDDDQRWVPTHVNVTVLRARSLRTKGKQGSRYVYTIIQVGKEKYTTGLVEKAEEPQWYEECSFELLPGLLEAGGMSAYPPGSSNLVLTVMHRVLIGLDVFLGQTIIPLHKVFQDGMCPRNEWLKLHSKAGRKEKERGELQVIVQFTRNNMTASMYDLTIKDKPRSAFGKLKDRVTGRKRGDVESSSAILPGRFAALSGSVGPPFAGDGGPDEPGKEEGVDEHRSKVKDFFLKGKLRKNSDTRSCSSLASDSSMASSAGDPFVSVELSRTPIYSSRVIEPFPMDTEGGIKVMTHKRAHSDEASKIMGVPHPSPAVENLKGQSMALSKSSLCINGSHIYSSEPVSPKSPSTIPAKRSLLEKCAPLSRSLQNLTRRSEDSQKSNGRRWSIEKSKKEDSEADGAQSQTQGAATSEGKPVQAAGPVEVVDKGKKLRKTLFSSGRSDSLPAKPEQSQVSAPLEGRRRGWFGSGDSQNKPRLGVSPKVESSSETPCQIPCSPSQPPCSLPLGCTTGSVSPPNGNHTNPFTHSSPTPPSISPSNPFLTRLQQNPFFEDLIAEEGLKSPTAGYCSLNSSLYHYPVGCSPVRNGAQNKMPTIKRERPKSMSRQRSLPSIMPETPDTNSNTNPNYSLSERAGEWDDFEAFATSRLKSPSGTPTRPPSAPFLSQVPNTNQMLCVNNKANIGLRVDEVDMGVSRPWDLPPLPPRRPMRTQGITTDSWLDRAQELAVQKEACFLSQTDFASLQHVRDGDVKRNSQILCSDKELHHISSVGCNKMDAELHSSIGLNKFMVGEARGHDFATDNNANSSPNDFGEDAHGSSECEYMVPETLCFPSDWETTVTESLCSSPQAQPKHDSESSCEIWVSNEQQCKTKTNGVGLLTLSPRDSNNNTDTSEFAFIDSGSSPSELQPPFEMNKDGVKSSKDGSNLHLNGSSLPRCSPGLPEDILCRMASELEMFSPINTRNNITSHLSDSQNHTHCSSPFERSCEELGGQKADPCEHQNTASKVNCESHNVADVLLNKEITVITQTCSSKDNTVTMQIKQELAEGNDLLTSHDDKEHNHLTEGNLNSEVCFLKNNKVEESCSTLEEQISFEDLHARVAPRNSRSHYKTEVRSARIRPRSTTGSPKTVSGADSLPGSPHPTSDLILHDPSPSPTPLAGTNSCLCPDPSLPANPPNELPSMGSTCSSTAQPHVDAPLSFSPEEKQPANVLLPHEESSPHPVRPLTNTTLHGEKKPESRSVLEKLKSTISPGRSAPPNTAEDEKNQLALMEARAQYQNMTNMELIALLLQQEMDVKKQQAETEVLVALLEKHEAELKKMKVQVRDLEDYIDKLLVRIMEQTPTLLQVRARPK